MTDLNRRNFLRNTSAAAAGVAATPLVGQVPLNIVESDEHLPGNPKFTSDWDRLPDRVWIGPEFWANPLQDWRIADGRLECVNPARNRNVHLLTRDIKAGGGDFEMRVTVGRVGGKLSAGKGSAGFRVGVEGPLKEYRNNIVFGSGLDAGIAADGKLFIGNPKDGKPVDLDRESVTLLLRCARNGAGIRIVLHALDGEGGVLETVEHQRNTPLAGNISLVANYGPTRLPGGSQNSPYAQLGTGKFWFDALRVDGSKIAPHPDRAFGPVLFTQYTLSAGTLTLTAQMPPLGEEDSQTVQLWSTPNDDNARTLGAAKIDPDARTATFRIDDWDASKDVPYRLLYVLNDEVTRFDGTIRRDPVDQDVLTVADISCNIHAAFPNHEYTALVRKANPDFVAFVGDQFYEGSGGYGVVRQPVETAILDMLHKWYLHGWTWRDVTRDRPSVAIPDDHDVYQGNIWGEAGAGPQKTQEAGGYGMPVRWVNAVHRTQTSHHPAPHDPEPLDSGITVYHGPLTYGRVSFAILADRMWKTGPDGVLPATGGRADHVTDPNFDPKTVDLEGLELLGERQMTFLDEWARDWKGADMKAVISQTIFTSMATTHGGNRQVLVADYDANGWPQTPRDAAVRAIRKCFAVHLAGDQHLPAVVQYGVDEHGDGAVAFAGPAVNVGYPRWWEPKGKDGKALELLGEHRDHLGNPLTVLAVKNGAVAPRRGVVEQMTDRASGLGLVRFDKQERTITFECWPFHADPTTDEQFEDWPIKVKQTDNGPKSRFRLPAVKVTGCDQPVLEVQDAKGELVYVMRMMGTDFVPQVYADGRYEITVSDPERGKSKSVKTFVREEIATIRIDL